jgi:hypothetical protein
VIINNSIKLCSVSAYLALNLGMRDKCSRQD